jgi:hypothetical protein
MSDEDVLVCSLVYISIYMLCGINSNKCLRKLLVQGTATMMMMMQLVVVVAVAG